MVARVLAGFIAGAIAVLVFHQPAGMLAKMLGLIPQYVPYNMSAHATALPAVAQVMKQIGFAGWPTLFNLMFWGGLWGALFGLLHYRLPGEGLIAKGLVWGLVIAVFNWTLLPFIQGSLRGLPNQAYFAGGDIKRLAAGLLFQVPFGFGLGLFYRMLRGRAY